jgi:hypothetical protein
MLLRRPHEAILLAIIGALAAEDPDAAMRPGNK